MDKESIIELQKIDCNCNDCVFMQRDIEKFKASKEAQKTALNKAAVMRRASKYYFRTEDDERCYTLDYHLADAKDEGLTEIELFEAVPEKVDGMFWCRAVDECSEEGYCGKQCEEYEPKNGKSGMCKHKCNTFHTHGGKVVFKVK